MDYKSESQRERSSPVGWIRLHKKLICWGWYADGNTLRVFLHLLLTANYKPSEFMGRTINRGQSVFGLQSLADVLKLSMRQVRVALEHLKTTGEVTIETTNRFSIATLVKYGDYQCSDADDDKPNDKPDDTQMTNKRQTDDKQMTTSKKKEGKKEEERTGDDCSKEQSRAAIIDGYTDSEDVRTAIREFIKMRTTIKKPLTDYALKLRLKDLDKLASSDAMKIAVLNQSVAAGWQDLYALKTPQNADTGYRRFGED